MTEDEARQRVILSMCPDRVCRVCGEPSRRITDVSYERTFDGGPAGFQRDMRRPFGDTTSPNAIGGKPHMAKLIETVGWSDCGHDSWRDGVWLDPFAVREGF